MTVEKTQGLWARLRAFDRHPRVRRANRWVVTIGSILLVLMLPLAIWGPGLFMMSWWHVRHGSQVSWHILDVDVPLPWFVWEAKSDGTRLTLTRGPDLDHHVIFGPYHETYEILARDYPTTESMIEGLEREKGPKVARLAIGGETALMQSIPDPDPGQIMEHWFLPDLHYDFIYMRREAEPSLVHELTESMSFDVLRPP